MKAEPYNEPALKRPSLIAPLEERGAKAHGKVTWCAGKFPCDRFTLQWISMREHEAPVAPLQCPPATQSFRAHRTRENEGHTSKGRIVSVQSRPCHNIIDTAPNAVLCCRVVALTLTCLVLVPAVPHLDAGEPRLS